MADGTDGATAAKARPIAGRALLLKDPGSSLKLQQAAAAFDFHSCAVLSRNLNQQLQHALRAGATQDFWLIMYARVAVLYIDRIDVYDRFVFFEAHAEQQRFATAVA